MKKKYTEVDMDTLQSQLKNARDTVSDYNKELLCIARALGVGRWDDLVYRIDTLKKECERRRVEVVNKTGECNRLYHLVLRVTHKDVTLANEYDENNYIG